MDIPAADVLLPPESRNVPLILLHPVHGLTVCSSAIPAEVSAGEPSPSQKGISAEMVEFHGRIMHMKEKEKKIKNKRPLLYS